MKYRGVFKPHKGKGEEYDVPTCPVCGEECDTLYSQGGIVLGCDVCVEEVNAWQAMTDEGPWGGKDERD